MTTLLFDLETFGFDFSADKGFILCASYKWLGQDKVTTIKYGGGTDDKELCRELARIIELADLVVTWNGKSFDMRFLQTRMLKHRLGYLPPVPHEDGLLTARRSLKMRRSLDNVAKFFTFKEQKSPVSFDQWLEAGLGNPKALRYVINHCEKDVLVLEEAYKLLGPLSKVHPNVSAEEGRCPFCHSKKLQQRGRVYALRHYRIRYHCRCGRWSTSAPVKLRKVG
jgi:uncharacterized protein YprB with RNaseH-like and TPR domain